VNVQIEIGSWKQVKLFPAFNFCLEVYFCQKMFVNVFSAVLFRRERSLTLFETFISNFPLIFNDCGCKTTFYH
jgi:hypothetical protein